MASLKPRTLDPGRAALGDRDKPPSPAARLVPQSKRCPKCDTIKPLGEFNQNRSRLDGLQGICRACANDAQRRWRAAGSPPRDPNYDYPLRQRIEKRCPRCATVKPVSEFGASNNRHDGYANYCKPCVAEKGREWRKAHPRTAEQNARHRIYSVGWRAKHRERILEAHRERYRSDPEFRARHLLSSGKFNARRGAKHRAIFDELKELFGCAICRANDARFLDLHHVDPAEKKFTIAARMISPMGTLLAEAEKCVVLCANCHRLVHAGEVALPAEAPRAIFPT